MLASCGDDADDGPRSWSVEITDAGYRPERLEIAAGDRVTFVNRSETTQSAKDERRGDIEHSPQPGATRHDGSEIARATRRGFSTHALFGGERQTVVFGVPRVYEYQSAFATLDGVVHKGTIEVVER